MKKKPVQTKTNKKKMKGEAKSGALYVVAALGIVALFGGVMAGGAIPTLTKLDTPPNQGPLYTCCDSGDGAACKPILEKQISYNGEAYALLKSNIAQGESGHIVPTDQFTPDGGRIFINSSNKTANYDIPGCEPGKDLIGINDPSAADRPCFGIPDEEIIYVCKDTVAECNKQINAGTTPFDAYFRVKDGDVPAEIASYCPKPKDTSGNKPQEIIGVPTPGGRKNLQLETFQVKQEKKLYEWLGAWCKPAINLYPTQKTNVHVEVEPKGKFTLTIPSYPNGGWDVTAYPDGRVVEGNKTYPYLYWEASLPDSLIKEPKEGYVVEKKELATLFSKALPELGLNQKETKEFSDYWVKALPDAKYYFVGVMPESEIDYLAPLKVQPAPDSIKRVTLYFKALDTKISVPAPKPASFERKGFTVTEWGGFFKADKAHKNFTCLM